MQFKDPANDIFDIDRRLQDAYYKGYGESQSDILSAIRSNPEAYHKFIKDVTVGHLKACPWQKIDFLYGRFKKSN